MPMYVSAHIRVNVDPGFARKFAVDNSRTKIAAADRRIDPRGRGNCWLVMPAMPHESAGRNQNDAIKPRNWLGGFVRRSLL